MYTKFATITLNTERRGQNSTQVFVAQPTPTQENLAGRLFILIEVEAKKSEALKVINFIIDDINENYYQNEKIALREKIDALKIENIFETVLVKTNKNLLDFLTKEKIQISPNNINATIGIVYQNQLHFANIGKNKALLLYKEGADNNYKMINVERSSAKEELGLKKLFSSIVSGDMPNKSYFIFANEALAEYLFNKELIEIITKLAPLGAAEQIKQTLARVNTYIPFLGIIIKNNAQSQEDGDEISTAPVADYRQDYAPRAYATPITANNTNASLPNPSLSLMEEKTEKILLSGPVMNGQQFFSWCGQNLKKINPFPPLGRFLKNIFKRERTEQSAPISGLDKNILINNTPGKNRLSKILLIILGICVLLFATNLIYKKLQNKKVAVAQKTQTQGDLIKQKEGQAESCILYNDQKCVQDNVNTLQAIFNGLSDADKQGIGDYDTLLAKFNELSGKVENVTKVNDLKEIANFTTLNSEAKPNNIRLATVAGAKILYAADNNKKTIYKINLKDNVTGILTSAKIASTLNYPVMPKDGNIYYLDNKQIIRLDPRNDSLNTFKFNYTDQQNIIGISIYNNRLYALDKSDNQVYRYTFANNIYDKSEARLKDKLDASTVVSFAIDLTGKESDVYFLKSTGELLRFYNGVQQGFKLDAVTPALSNPSTISILKNIYVLEPSGKRLLVFDKNGKFIKQYQSDKLTNPLDFFVDESAKKAYFLNDTAVEEMDL